MAIGTYGELKTAVANWLARSDLTSRIPEFISLAEADMKRNLRNFASSTSTTMTADSDELALPATAREIKYIRYNTAALKFSLNHVAAVALNNLRREGTGIPLNFTVLGPNFSKIVWDIKADSAYDIIIAYYTFTAIGTTDGSTSSLLTQAPDLYLYGALAHSAPFLEHDERVPMWQALYQKALDDENTAQERMELGGPTTINLPVVFG